MSCLHKMIFNTVDVSYLWKRAGFTDLIMKFVMQLKVTSVCQLVVSSDVCLSLLYIFIYSYARSPFRSFNYLSVCQGILLPVCLSPFPYICATVCFRRKFHCSGLNHFSFRFYLIKRIIVADGKQRAKTSLAIYTKW